MAGGPDRSEERDEPEREDRPPETHLLFEQSLIEAVPRFGRSADAMASVAAAAEAGAPIGFTGVLEGGEDLNRLVHHERGRYSAMPETLEK